jgi:hypothetical protein
MLPGHFKEEEKPPLLLRELESSGELISLEEQELLRESELETDMTAVDQESEELRLPSVVNSVVPFHHLETELGLQLNVKNLFVVLKSN